MSTNTFLKVLSEVSSRMISIASRIGIPAEMNTESWREKPITTSRGTRRFVSSSLSNVGFSSTDIGWSPRAANDKRAAPLETASSTPLTVLPSISTASNLYFVMIRSFSKRVDAADYLFDGRDVMRDEIDRLLAQRSHTLTLCEATQLLLRCPSDDEPLDFRGHLQKLIYTDTRVVSGAGAV